MPEPLDVDIVKGTFCFNPKDARAKPPATLPSSEPATDYVTVGSSAPSFTLT